MVDACDDRIREGEIIRRDSKNQMVRQMEKYAPATVVWRPKMDRGCGTSPFHKNGWRTVERNPIIPADVTKSAKAGAAPSAKEVYDLELKAPAGKFRVVGVDLFSHEDYLTGDYASEAKPTRSPTITTQNGRDQWMTSST